MDNKTFPEIVTGTKGKLYNSFPEGKLKDYLWWLYIRNRWGALRQELINLPVISTGRSDKLRFLRLSSGIKFYGWETSLDDRRAYKYLDKSIKEKIPEDYFGIATDIITRYKYPQSTPFAPCYTKLNRLGFSWHHTETILDLNISTWEKINLSSNFGIHKGDTVLDIGSYIGYGTMGLSRIVGKSGKVVAFECNPKVLEVLLTNITANSISNIDIVNCAAWNKNEEIILGRGEPQEKSLTEGTENSKENLVVKGRTIDSIVRELKLTKVDFVSLSINGAELEALEGMEETLKEYSPNLSVTGWVHRNGKPLWKEAVGFLEARNYSYVVGKRGRILAWKAY